jgi:putative sterol carrier protein
MTGLRPFSDEWAESFRAAIDEDADYRVAAKDWTWPVAFILNAAPALGYENDIAVQFALDRGSCRSAAIVPASAVTAPFVFRADFPIWKQMAEGTLDPLVAVARRQVTLVGALTTLMLHSKAAKALVACAQRVPTQFPDEV